MTSDTGIALEHFSGTTYPESKSRQKFKQVARIIKYLLKDFEHSRPDIRLPSDWVVDNLVYNCPNQLLSAQDWQSIVVNALSYIARHTGIQRTTEPHFTQIDTNTPLFPNNEYYDEQDVHRFSCALIDYLYAEIPVND